jgi:hypothetical protein
VVQAVAHQVHQRIAQLFQHGLVELGVLAAQRQLDALAQMARQIVHQAREAVEDHAHRHAAQAHHALLQRTRVARQLRQPLAQPRDSRVIEWAGVVEAAQHRLGDHQLAHHVHERIDLVDADAQRGQCRVVLVTLARAGRRQRRKRGTGLRHRRSTIRRGRGRRR